MAMITVKMTKMACACGLDQSIIAQPIAFVIDMKMAVAVRPFGRSYTLISSYDIPHRVGLSERQNQTVRLIRQSGPSLTQRLFQQEMDGAQGVNRMFTPM